MIRTKYLTITKYIQDVRVNEAKKLMFPKIRGTWLPSFNIQIDFGIAINWLGWRVRISARN